MMLYITICTKGTKIGMMFSFTKQDIGFNLKNVITAKTKQRNSLCYAFGISGGNNLLLEAQYWV